MVDLSRYQDVFGQMSFLKSYTHLIVGFPLSDDISEQSVIKLLEDASGQLSSIFPWLACKVINEGSSPGNTGVFKVAPCPLWATPNSIVRVKGCYDLCPSYQEILKAGGPIPMLEGKILAPCVAFPQSYQESESNPAPVATIQVNFIKGGLLLDFAAQHNIMDGSGIAQWMRMFGKAMRGEELSVLDIEQGNRDRRNMVPLLGTDEPMLDHSALQRLQQPTTQHGQRRPSSTWHYFRFSAAKLAQLKALAARSEDFVSSVGFITTNDALSAFCWKRLVAVRLLRGSVKPNTVSKFFRAVDARRAMGVPKEYMGHMVYIAITSIESGKLVEAPLAAIASEMRKDVSDVNTEYTMRSFVTLIANTPDKSTIAYGATFNPDNDLGMSSFTHWGTYGVEFGLLGMPELVRRANFQPPIESDIYLMPSTNERDIDALLCVTDEDLKGLRSDEQWSSYTEYIG